MSEMRQVRESVVVETTPELAFEAVTKDSELREWFCDQKARFRRITQLMLFDPDHTSEHVEQIEQTVEAVRG
jgi:uncharacterized protein YndB with AHSA1/START domain